MIDIAQMIKLLVDLRRHLYLESADCEEFDNRIEEALSMLKAAQTAEESRN